MSKKQSIPTYVAHIEAAEGSYRTVITRDGAQVYAGTIRPNRKAARMDAARFVVQSPENQRNLQWDDPFLDEPEDEQGSSQEEEKPGIDLEGTRNWVQSHPRIKDEEGRVIFTAMDSFEALKQAKVISREKLEPIIAAARCPRRAAWDVGGRLLAELAQTNQAAQEAFRELVASRKASERLQAVLSLSARMPVALLQELLSQTVNDRSKRVRQWTAEQCNMLNLREIVPELLRRAETEPDPDVKRGLEFNAALIRDGYRVEIKEGGRLRLYIRLRDGGLTSQDISQKDVKRGRVPAIVTKCLAELSWLG
ncbi:MAG TPA: hypothetical protein VH682_15500 [Gemmataceae bacterium]